MKLRPYQQGCIDGLYKWWSEHRETTDTPLVVVPTGGGKSIIIAELVRLLFDTYAEDHPRTVVLVPSKELAEQNAEKLVALLPSHISVGYYSASLGRKVPDADVIVATIGSIHKDAHLLGNIRCVVIDEAHLVSSAGAEAGRYRQFLTSLAKYCRFRVVGWTATPFHGNGVWLTAGEDPLFTGVAHTVKMGELIADGFLSPLVRPVDLVTRINTDGVSTTGGDFNMAELSDRVNAELENAATEALSIAADRRKWIAFTPTVANATAFRDILRSKGVSAEVVTGDTEKLARASLIRDFKTTDNTRCLITVMALATGFDAPSVDCLIWLRPTKSPVLYVQGFGRGTRISPEKQDCLVLDFTDTVERLGPVDAIKGRHKKAKKEGENEAPHRICSECGERCAPHLPSCPSCGFEFPPPEVEVRRASNAAVLASQIAPKINTYEVDRVTYKLHRKEGKPDSLRVDYWHGMRVIVSEWVCCWHPPGFAQAKGAQWWGKRTTTPLAPTASDAAQWLSINPQAIDHPSHVVVNETGKFPELVRVTFNQPKLETIE